MDREIIPFHPTLTIGFHVKELAKLWGLKSRLYTPYLHATLETVAGEGGHSFFFLSFLHLLESSYVISLGKSKINMCSQTGMAPTTQAMTHSSPLW